MPKQTPRPRRRKLTARSADKYQLYQWSVQSPDEDIDFVIDIYKGVYGKRPRHFREDFAGTALLTAEWIRRGVSYTAEAFDTDPEPVNWGMAHNFAPLGKAAERATLHIADVREPSRQKPHVRCAQNFSWFVFKTRAELLEYFSSARRDLADEGLFVLDIFGGPQAIDEACEDSVMDEGFTYVWDQREYWPVTGEYSAEIHFEFPDGSVLQRAFSYDWRLWSLPETIDALREVGFGAVDVYWEQIGRDGIHGDGTYRPSRRGENWLSWVAYLICQK